MSSQEAPFDTRTLLLPLAAITLACGIGYWLRDDPPPTDGPVAAVQPAPPKSRSVQLLEREAIYGKNYTTPAVAGHSLLIHADQNSNPEARISGAYPAEHFVEAAELNEARLAEQVTVLDVRPWYRYADRHVPGAAHVDANDWIGAFTTGQPSSIWQQKIGAVGIDGKTPVVVYDDGSGQDGPCIWWILRDWGVKDVKLLNGGWPSWLFLGAHQDDSATNVTPRSAKLDSRPARSLSKAEFIALRRSGRSQIIDARTSPGPALGGNRVYWLQVFDQGLSHFKPAKELAGLFAASGIAPSRSPIVWGDSLREAAPVAFALELLGASGTRIYLDGGR